MTALINNDHLVNPNVAKYLRESQCGILRDSQDVCCNINDIDFGGETQPIETTTRAQLLPSLPTNLQPPNLPPQNDPINAPRISNEKCGELKLETNSRSTPLKWIGELWFKVESNSRTQFEVRCFGTLISQ
jgi:hypothetical protein